MSGAGCSYSVADFKLSFVQILYLMALNFETSCLHSNQLIPDVLSLIAPPQFTEQTKLTPRVLFASQKHVIKKNLLFQTPHPKPLSPFEASTFA